jgi:microsomal dipeptidase-like Zn-dependent dipeptidase
MLFLGIEFQIPLSMSQKVVVQVIILFILFTVQACLNKSRKEISRDEAVRIHHSLLTIDSHTDTPLRFSRRSTDLSQRSDPRRRGGKLDFPRMQEGGLDGVFFAVFVGQGPRTPEENEEVKKEALTLFDSIHSVVDDSAKLALEQEYYDINRKYLPNLATVSQFCDHFDHIVDLVGINHVGFGSDYDGGAALEDCFDVTELPYITHELLIRGYSRSELQKFWSGNLLGS